MPKLIKTQTLRTENLRTSYKKYYVDQVADPIGVSMYLQIVKGFVKKMMQKIYDGKVVELAGGESLGSVRISGRKMKPTITASGRIKGLGVDWQKTRKLWKEDPEAKKNNTAIHFFNEHSDGVKYNLRWLVRDTKLKNKSYYTLAFFRTNRRAVAGLIKAGKEYYIIPDKVKNKPNGNESNSEQILEGW